MNHKEKTAFINALIKMTSEELKDFAIELAMTDQATANELEGHLVHTQAFNHAFKQEV